MSLTAGASRLTILALRKADDTATVFVTTTDTKTKTNVRGMTRKFESFDLAITALAKLEQDAAQVEEEHAKRRVHGKAGRVHHDARGAEGEQVSTHDARGLAAARSCVRGIRTTREIRDLLHSIEEQAKEAQRMSPTRNENLCDMLDSIVNDVQAVIELMNTVRRGET